MTFTTFYESEEYTIYCDMDGVLTDFEHQWKTFSKSNLDPDQFKDKYGESKFWEMIDSFGLDFWKDMKFMVDGKELWNYIKKYDPIILTSPSHNKVSEVGKNKWVKDNLGLNKIIFSHSKEEYAAKNRILIDDRESNINKWKLHGGIGILHSTTKNTIEELKSYSL